MLRVFDCFAGYGGAEFALKKAGISYECVGFSEIDKYAVQCFEQNHSGVKNFGNITKIDWSKVPDFDLLTGGFPCQDISKAGKQDLSKGRSVLVNELIRCLKEKQPKYFLFENVAAIEEKTFKHFLRGIENDLKNCGYVLFRRMLNTKDFGVPQNRERVWFIGYRKDLHVREFGWTPYPQPEQLKIKLKDILEDKVDEKYFLKQEQIEKIFNRAKENKARGLGFGLEFLPQKDVCSGLSARDFKEPKCVDLSQKTRDVGVALSCANELSIETGEPVQLDLYHLQHGELRPLSTYIPQHFGVARCLQAGEPKEVMVSFVEPTILDLYNGKARTDYAQTLSNPCHNSLRLGMSNSVRRLTPKECFRLMGFLNDEIRLDGLSDTQKYKLAGNGWDINLVSKIFKSMEMEV